MGIAEGRGAMKYVLTFLIVAAMFLLVTVTVAVATEVELGPGWYLIGPVT